MYMKLMTVHGGDLDVISREYNIPKNEIVNFSGNVNPLGLPPSVKKAIKENVDCATDYPDVSYVGLRNAISSYTGVKSENIVVGNGSTELISAFIKVSEPKKAVIVSPAYSEYLKEIKLLCGEVELFELMEDKDYMLDVDTLISQITKDTDIVVICNPNNPTGTYVTIDQTEKILKHCMDCGVRLMMDETYVEFSEPEKHVSAMPLIDKYPNLMIVRGTSKFFACPGLRLGYGACSDKDTLDYVNSHKDPWSVNVFAELAGKVMFVDKDFIKSTTDFISAERTRIKEELSKWKNIKVYDTQSNFFLVEILRDDVTSDEIFHNLIQKKLLIRDASNFPYLGSKFLRFCILNKEENNLLLSNLKKIIEK